MLKRFIIFSLFLLFSSAVFADVNFPSSSLSIITASGKVDFSVEVATTEEQHTQGLMFRKALAIDHGMIFEFTNPQHVDMWMKNTLIPLDMVFINNGGIITQIVKNAKPESTDIISSGQDAKAVLELMGGACVHYHIEVGDKVVY